MLASAFTHVLGQLEYMILRFLHGLAVMYTKLGQDGLKKLGLSHRHTASRMIALDLHTNKIPKFYEICHLKSVT